jgi:hypothetical protein
MLIIYLNASSMRTLVTTLILITLCLSSCAESNKKEPLEDTSNLNISLNWTDKQTVKFPEIGYTNFLMYSIYNKDPDRYNKNLSEVRNSPKLDSFMLVSLGLQNLPLYKANSKNQSV